MRNIQTARSVEIDEMIEVMRKVRGDRYTNAVIVSTKSAQAAEMFRQLSLHLGSHCGDHHHESVSGTFMALIGDINAMAIKALDMVEQREDLAKDARALFEKSILVRPE